AGRDGECKEGARKAHEDARCMSRLDEELRAGAGSMTTVAVAMAASVAGRPAIIAVAGAPAIRGDAEAAATPRRGLALSVHGSVFAKARRVRITAERLVAELAVVGAAARLAAEHARIAEPLAERRPRSAIGDRRARLRAREGLGVRARVEGGV